MIGCEDRFLKLFLELPQHWLRQPGTTTRRWVNAREKACEANNTGALQNRIAPAFSLPSASIEKRPDSRPVSVASGLMQGTVLSLPDFSADVYSWRAAHEQRAEHLREARACGMIHCRGSAASELLAKAHLVCET